MHAHAHAHTEPAGFANGLHSEIITGVALRFPRGQQGTSRGCQGHTHPAGALAPDYQGRSAEPATPAPRGQEDDATAGGWSSLFFAEREWELETTVPDLVPAADLGQSPPRLGLSFPTRRSRLTVPIAEVAPFSRSFRELGGTPSSAGSPFLGPRLRRNPTPQQRVIRQPD